MNELTVFNRDGQLYTDSREVAEMIGKDHAHLMRDITGYIEVLNQSKIGFVDFFKKSGYKDAKGEERPCYSITKKGCEFVANKLTGKKGIAFTAIYVNAFHDMENKLAGKPTKPKKFSLASFNHLLEINVRQMKAANQPATHIASWTNGMTREVLAPFGIDVPALPDAVPTTYDATEMAKKLGVYSKSGNPHPQPITAIIKKVGLAPGETFTTETTVHRGGKDVPDVRYAGSVLDKVHKWLDTEGWPNPIVLGKKYNVVYKERSQS
jgi:Rha family phage regulatory protein